jgi:putative hydrolase of the HAD superfamily
MPSQPPCALLFDMGGVVIDIDFDRAFSAWQDKSELSVDEIRNIFTFDLQYQRHERGEITASAYYDHLADILQLENNHDYIAAGWNAIFVSEIAETVAMVRAVRSSIPCYAFTNSNAAHAVTWRTRFTNVIDSFDRIFSSHEIGLRKPEPRAFAHIAELIGVPLESLVFFDDLLENVESAAAAGLASVHVRGPSDVRLTLESLGYLR